MPKPRLLLDENIGVFVTANLRQDGYDIFSILESMPGAIDLQVLAKARREKRILITLDKDFGRLVHFRFRKHAGVILLRLNDESPKNIYRILTLTLNQPSVKLKGKFVVATETKIRLR